MGYQRVVLMAVPSAAEMVDCWACQMVDKMVEWLVEYWVGVLVDE